MAQCEGLQIPKAVGSNPTLTSSLWSRSLLVRISPCHGDGTSSILVETAKLCTLRLSVRTRPFHGRKRSSILLGCTKQFRASVTVAQQTPNLLDGVRLPGSEPVVGGISLGAKLKISNLRSSVRFRYPAPVTTVLLV